MLYENLKEIPEASHAYKILFMAHAMLDSDEGLCEEQYDVLREFVYDQIGPTVEMTNLFEHVDATDSRFYITEAQMGRTNYKTISSCD